MGLNRGALECGKQERGEGSLLSDLFRRFTQTRSAVVSVRVEGRVDRGADVSQVVGHLLADWKEKPTGLSAQAMPDSFVRRGKPFL